MQVFEFMFSINTFVTKTWNKKKIKVNLKEKSTISFLMYQNFGLNMATLLQDKCTNHANLIV